MRTYAQGGINITLPVPDWTTIVPNLVGLFFDAVGKELNDILHSAFNGAWNSSANVIGQTDLGQTWDFGPIHDQVLNVQDAAKAVLLFAVILLGLKSMLGGVISRHSDVLDEFVNGIVAAVVLVAAFPIVVPMLINLVNQAATAVGTVDISKYISSGWTDNALVQAVLFIILLFFALRLLMKAFWRIGFLAVMLPIGMFACVVYAVPQLRWVLGWWSRMWGGMLVAQVPSVMALSIGVQVAAHGSGPGAFVASIAFLQLATDLYTLIPFGMLGHAAAPWGRLPMQAAQMAGGIHAGGAAGAAALPEMRPQMLEDAYGYK